MRTLAVPRTWFLLVSIAAIIGGLVIGAIHLSFHGRWQEKVCKAAGIVLVVGGAFAAWSYALTPDRKLPFILDDEDAAFARARAEGKGVMIDFAASWCLPCKELELTFADPEVHDLITQNFVPLKFDVTDEDTEINAERRKRYDAGTLPAVVWQSADRKDVARINRYMKPRELLDVLRPAVAKLRAGTALATGDPCK
jgi:thiol:disulfide interchange protein DsbD